jgi:glycosyltransferase involved in cell wall biosynthesis
MTAEKTLNVLLTTQWFTPEPESSRGLAFAKWLQGRGHRVTVLTGFPNYPHGTLYPGYSLKWRQWDDVDGVRVLRVPLYPNHDQSATRRSLNYLSFTAAAAAIGMPMTGNVDVVYAMATPPTTGFPPFLNRVFRRVPYLFNVTDIWPEAVTESGMVAGGLKNRVVARGIDALCRLVYGNAAFVTAISRGYRRILIERGLEPARVHAVFNWVDEELFQPRPRNAELAAKLGLTGKFNFLYGGNFGPFQGIDTIIRAAARLQHIPDIQIALVGTGQLDRELRQLAADIGAKNVHFTGRVDQTLMPEIYSLADVLLIHLNESEYLRATIPSKTQTYLAMGRPIVIAASGDSADVVAESGAGLVVPPRDEEALARAMLDMYNRASAEREALGRRGRQFYLDEMSLEKGAAKIETLLHHAVGATLPSAPI